MSITIQLGYCLPRFAFNLAKQEWTTHSILWANKHTYYTWYNCIFFRWKIIFFPFLLFLVDCVCTFVTCVCVCQAFVSAIYFCAPLQYKYFFYSVFLLLDVNSKCGWSELTYTFIVYSPPSIVCLCHWIIFSTYFSFLYSASCSASLLCCNKCLCNALEYAD